MQGPLGTPLVSGPPPRPLIKAECGSLRTPAWTQASGPGRAPGAPPPAPRCAPRAGRAAARRREGRALGRWSPGPSAGSGGLGRDVTAGRGRGSGRAGGEAGEVFSSFKKAAGRARPCVRARLRGSELAGTVSHRAGEGGRARGPGRGRTPPSPRRPSACRAPGAAAARTRHARTRPSQRFSGARGAEPGPARVRRGRGVLPRETRPRAAAQDARSSSRSSRCRRRRRRRVDAKYQFSSPFQVSTRPSGCSLRERRNFGALCARRRHHEVGRGSPSLPALDWQLPSHSGPYELRIEVQPKSHHRAHYETEGSRGAVKALAGGHPSVQLHGYMESEPLTLQLFIGTADDRLLRPHAFYQVHRITGKTVSTTSHEAILSNTKVLEIPLLPENNMRAIIDCAGILKLRNSDIELRKGETDIGRKNTRVRLVFRVHVPQPNGRTLSLQVASNPIECSQRSAQELPLVEKQSAASGPVLGGKRMVLSGHNFLQDSKVIFVEKAPDGHHIWEMEAKIDGALCKPNSLVVEIPPFRNQRITSPVQVNFYVCNGKRKRSQYQHFTYLPANVPIIKTEPSDDYEPALTCGPMSQGLSPLPKPCYGQPLALPPDPGSCLAPGFPPRPQSSASPELHDLSCAPYGPATAGPGHGPLGLPRPVGGVLAGQEAPRPAGVPPGPPQPPPPAPLQPQVSPPSSGSCSPGCRPALCPHSPSSPLPPGTQEPTRLQPCGPARPPGTGHQQQQPSEVPSSEPAAARPLPAPEVREDSNHSLAPIPVTVKREPQELDPLDLDDVNEIIRNDLSSTNLHS
uniref:Nuclear factor of activated T-cells, cytoplasmic 1 n=1 Tax=Tursiops truncatus TaxID=9739 RepID=A0A6J3PV86_TURTR|nr:nuclear factor of activated T-cells, cytoplasmic 1 isoform X5 [Tursiops truncatus]